MATALADRVWQVELRGVNAYLVSDDTDYVVGTKLDVDGGLEASL